jgi:hypothetical protein
MDEQRLAEIEAHAQFMASRQGGALIREMVPELLAEVKRQAEEIQHLRECSRGREA